MSDSGTSHRLRFLAASAVAGASIAAVAVLWGRRRRRKSLCGPARVTDLLIYPIKSCAEIRREIAVVGARGFEGDRVLQVTDSDGKFCTPRDKDKVRLFHVCCQLDDLDTLTLSYGDLKPLSVSLSKTTSTVRAKILGAPRPNDNYEMLLDYGDEVATWLASATGIEGCRLTGIGPDYHRTVFVNPKQADDVPEEDAPVSLGDEAPYLLTTLASLCDLNRRLGERGQPAVDMRRFRPNMVLEGTRPWEEDSWKRIRIGTAEFWVWQRCSRCVMTTIDRDTLERGPEPLKTMTTFRERAHGCRNFGMHLVPVAATAGAGIRLSIGDAVEVLEYDAERKAEWQQRFGRL
mmetsp:Transcript_65274/g.123652  ORF Transcript_65274/g.123652 Transcript_65274/m.123652 type:complete len:347 (+) Transcript_65274:37-1077(+)